MPQRMGREVEMRGGVELKKKSGVNVKKEALTILMVTSDIKDKIFLDVC